MNLYTHDLALFDFANFTDPIIQPLSQRSSSSNSFETLPAEDDANYDNPAAMKKKMSPLKHRHDGLSPLPLGMDWSPPPRKWDGRDSVWPHDPQTGWSYCVTIPSWVVLPKSRDSDPVVFFRVQVGIQSPEGITTTRGIIRRFSDFLKLFSELKNEFPKKHMPPTPSKRILRMRTRTLLEERRRSLEDWMEKLLSDIDLSRSAPVATFLELEAAVRSSFYDANQQEAYSTSSGAVASFVFQPNSDVSVVAGSLSITSDHGNDSPYEISELGTPRHRRHNLTSLGMDNSPSEQDLSDPIETTFKHDMFNRNFILENHERISKHKMNSEIERSVMGSDKVLEKSSKALAREDETEILSDVENSRMDRHVRRLSTESVGSELSSVRATSDISNFGTTNLTMDASFSSELQFSRDLVVAFPLDEQRKLNRVLNTVRQRLSTAKADMEDLIARLNQEVSVRQFLTTKVKDLEVDLETTRQNCKENMQQAVLLERERFTQMQWDMEELRRKSLEMELKLKSEQDEKEHAESTNISIIQENKMLLQDLYAVREQLENLQKHHEELDLKSKADVKLLVKEVKSLRSSQLELKHELSRLIKEKLEVEKDLQKQKQRMELADTTNAKLLHECQILRNRLQECSVNFLIEEEDKLIVDNTSSPSDAIDLLTTSDNRIGLLLAEAQLLAQDVENAVAMLDETRGLNGGDRRANDDELRKMLTDIFIDNATLRKQVNSVIRCTLNTHERSEDDEDEEEETNLRKTVLSKFLER